MDNLYRVVVCENCINYEIYGYCSKHEINVSNNDYCSFGEPTQAELESIEIDEKEYDRIKKIEDREIMSSLRNCSNLERSVRNRKENDNK